MSWPIQEFLALPAGRYRGRIRAKEAKLLDKPGESKSNKSWLLKITPDLQSLHLPSHQKPLHDKIPRLRRTLMISLQPLK
jgi:hypothetical protein